MTMHHLRVRDLMTTALITVRPDTTVADALDAMRAAGIRHLLVIEPRGRLVGILSDRDLLQWRPKGKVAAGHRVDEVMSRRIASVAPETPAREAAAILVDRKIGALPVLDEKLAVVGIVTETDFLRYIVEELWGLDGREASFA